MIRHTPLILFCALALSAGAQVPFAWDAEASRALAAAKDVYRGETVALRPDWLGYGTAVDTNGWAFTLCWQTNGMGDAWWTDSTNAFLWTPERDCGASRYTLFIRASAPGGVSYRANAVLRMLPSPGFNPAVLPPPSAYPTLAVELAPLVAPLIDAIEETDPLALGVIATQRVERVWSPDAMEYRDGTGGVWRVRSVQQGYWTLSVLGTEYGTATNAYYEILTAPFDFWNYAYGFGTGDGQAYFSWHANDEQPGQGQIYVEVQGEEGATDGFLETNQVASGSIDFSTSMYHTLLRMAWSNEPPLTVTQHVDTVELKSTLAGPRLALIEAETNLWRTAYALASATPTRAQIPAIVMSNSVSQLVIWTNAVGAATNMAWRENGVWRTNALGGGGADLPEGVITNGQADATVGRVRLNNDTVTAYYGNFLYTIEDGNLSSMTRLANEGNSVFFNGWRDDWSENIRRLVLRSSGNVEIPNGSLTVAQTNTADVLRSESGALILGVANYGPRIVNSITNGQSAILGASTVRDELVIEGGGNVAKFWSTAFYSPYGYAFKFWNGVTAPAALQWDAEGNVDMPSGNLTVAKTATAAELRSLGGITLPNIGTNTTAYLFVSNNLMWVRGVTP